MRRLLSGAKRVLDAQAIDQLAVLQVFVEKRRVALSGACLCGSLALRSCGDRCGFPQ